VQWPAVQVALAPLTCASIVQSVPQAPQLCTSVDRVTHVLPHALSPAVQPQAPHWQLAPQACVPLSSQAWVALGAQTPLPLHVDQSLHTPLTHERVWLPQLPHAWLEGPVQEAARGAIIPGTTAGVGTDDQAPHSGVASVLGAHAVVTTITALFAAGLVHAPGGSEIVAPLSVQSLPSLSTTQQSLSLQTPAPPGGNWSATLTPAPATPSGRVIEHVATSSVTGIADAKQSCTSKQPTPAPDSTDASNRALPLTVAGS
jgi:hypothetical protein